MHISICIFMYAPSDEPRVEIFRGIQHSSSPDDFHPQDDFSSPDDYSSPGGIYHRRADFSSPDDFSSPTSKTQSSEIAPFNSLPSSLLERLARNIPTVKTARKFNRPKSWNCNFGCRRFPGKSSIYHPRMIFHPQDDFSSPDDYSSPGGIYNRRADFSSPDDF